MERYKKERDDARYELKRHRSERDDARQDLKRHRSERDDARQDLKRHRSERDYARGKYDQLSLDYAQATEQFQVDRQLMSEELDRVERSAHHLQTVLDSRELFLGFQTSDEDVRAQFDSMFSQIETWSRHFTYGSVDALNIDKHLLSHYQYAMSSCLKVSDVRRMLAAKEDRRLFVRGWTALVVYRRIFAIHTSRKAYGTDLWLDETSATSLVLLEEKLSCAGNQESKSNAFDGISC